MKYFELDGTNKDSFSIGLGANKVELISVNGELYFRNFKDLTRPVGSGTGGSGTSGSSVPKTYVAAQSYDAGELITYNETLWRINATITTAANSSFNAILNYVDRIADYSNILQNRIDSNVTLTKADHIFLLLYDDLNPSITGGGTIKLPSPFSPISASIKKGYQITIQNDSNRYSSNILNSAGTLISAVDPGRVALATLLDETTNSWSVMQIGGGTSSTGGGGEKLTVAFTQLITSGVVGSIVELNSSGVWVLATDTENHDNTEKTLGIIESIAGPTTTILLYGYDSISNYSLVAGDERYLSSTTAGQTVSKTSLPENDSAYYLFKSLGAQKILFTPQRIRRPKSIGNTFTKASHGFIVGNGVYIDSLGAWQKSTEADQPIAVVSKVINANSFSVITSGYLKLNASEWNQVLPDITDTLGINNNTLTPGSSYYALTRPAIGTINYTRSFGAFTSSSGTSKRAIFTAISTSEVIVSIGSEITAVSSASSGPNIFPQYSTFNQTLTLRIGMPIYYDSTFNRWDAAIANSNDKVARAIITSIPSPLLAGSQITATLYGEVIFSSATDISNILESAADGSGGSLTGGFISGRTYYLSDLTPGKLTISSPLLSAPILHAITATSCIVQMGFQAIEAGEAATRLIQTVTYAGGTITLNQKAIAQEYIDIYINGTYLDNGDFSYNGTTLVVTFTGASTGTLPSVSDTIEIKYFKGVNIAAKYNSYLVNGIVTAQVAGTYPATAPNGTYTDSVLEIILPFSPQHKGLIDFMLGGTKQGDADYDLWGNTIVTTYPGATPGVDSLDYQIILKEEIVPNKAIYGYIGRKTVSLGSGSSADIKGSIFINDLRSGVYEFFIQEDPRYYGTLFVKMDYATGLVSALDFVIPFPLLVTTSLANAGTLNVNTNVAIDDITIENLTANSITLTMFRKV